METLTAFARFEIRLLIGGLMLIAAYQTLTGRINTRGLLFEKTSGSISPGRVQLLFLTLIGALFYLFSVARNPEAKDALQVPRELLLILGASNGIYLGGKANLLSLLRRNNGA